MTFRRIAYIVAGVLVIAAVFVLALRFALSRVSNYQEPVVAWLSEVVGADVHVGSMQAALSGIEPVVELSNVQVVLLDGSVGGRIERARVGFDLFASLFGGGARISELHVSGTDFQIVTDADGNSRVAGLVPLPSGFLTRSSIQDTPLALPDFSLRLERADIHWRNEATGIDHWFENVGAAFESDDGRLQFAANARLPGELGHFAHVAADLRADTGASGASGQWGGQVYLRADGANLAQWARLGGGQARPDAAGVLTAELWSSWRDGVLQRLTGLLDCEDCVADREADPVSVQARLSWEKQGGGWRLGLLDFGWMSSGLAVERSEIGITYHEGVSRLVLRMPTFNTELLRSETGSALLRTAGVDVNAGSGVVKVSAHMSHPDFQPPVLSGETGSTQNFHDLLAGKFRFTARYAARYINHLVSTAEVKASSALIGLKGVAVKFSGWSDYLFRPDEVSVSVRHVGDTYAVDNLSVRFGDARLSGKFAWRGRNKASAALELKNLPLASIREFLPRQGGKPRLAAWLDQAFVGGVVKTARVKLDGALSSFPFKNGGGQFHAEAEVEGATLNYRAGRKPLREIDARVTFDNQRLAAEVSGLRYYDMKARSAQVVMQDVTLPLVEVDAIAAGPLASVFDYLKDAQLVNPDSVVIRGLEPGGGSLLDLSVKVPLSKKVDKPVTVEGALSFNRASLRVAPLDLEFNDISGVLDFDRNGGRASTLSANLNGVPVVAAAEPAGGELQGGTLLTIKGRLPVSKVLDMTNVSFDGAVQGSSLWQADLLIPGLRAGADYELKMTLASSLEGIEVSLPSPFGKSAPERRRFSADITLGARSEYALFYGREIRAMWGGHAPGKPLSGYLHFGLAAPPSIERGHFKLSGRIDQAVELDDWLEMRGPGLDVPVDKAVLSFAGLRKGGELLGEASVEFKSAAGGNELRIDSPWARGSALIPADGGAVSVKMEKLFLPKGPSTVADTALDPATLPPLEIEIAYFRRGGLSVSDLNLATRPMDGGMKVDRLLFDAGKVRVTVDGQWLFDGRVHSSNFHVDANGVDYGKALKLLGVSNNFKDGSGFLAGDVTWEGSPVGFALKKLEGDIRLSLTDGVIEKAEPGIGRLLGLFSVGHIVRRLSLDFRDVIEKGLPFDTLEGNLNFHEGVMRTEDFVVVGPALMMVVAGDNLIAERRYDQRIDVVPNLSAGLPVAGALLGGPIGAAAVYLVDKLTNIGSKMDKTLTLRYRLHGSWDDPQVDFEGTPEVKKGAGKAGKLFKKMIPGR